MDLNIVWQHEAPDGGMSVCESEHLFGYDVIFFRLHDGHPVPIMIIVRMAEMTINERRAAVAAASWADSERWDIFRSIIESLHHEGACG